LINDTRIRRMTEHLHRNGGDVQNVYAPAQLLADLTGGIWSELAAEQLQIDLYRRNLQRAHVALLISQLQTGQSSSDLPALARAELWGLRLRIEPLVTRALDPVAKAHLAQLLAVIKLALDPPARNE
jgi:hypothetical protein